MIQQVQPIDVFEIPDPQSLREHRILQHKTVALAYARESLEPTRRQLKLLAIVGIILAFTSISVPVLSLFIAESPGFGAGLFAAVLNPFIMWIKDGFGVTGARLYIFTHIGLSAVLLIGSLAAFWLVPFGRRMLLLYAIGSMCLFALASAAVLKSMWPMLGTDDLAVSAAMVSFVPQSFLLQTMFPLIIWAFLRTHGVRQLFAATDLS
jgi:hypothetical protein